MGQIVGYKHGTSSLDKVDPRLIDIVKHAIAAQPYDAIIRSGSESRGPSDKGNHMEGYAIDVTLVDKNGNKIPDKGPGSFAQYEPYAQAARVYQQQAYPELNKTFRWGAGFSDTTMDLMHLDITPGSHGAMKYYNWDTGLTGPGKTAFPGVVSNGGLGGVDGSRRVAQIQGYLSDPNLVPPDTIPSGGRTAVAAIDNVAPRPMPSGIAMGYTGSGPPAIPQLPVPRLNADNSGILPPPGFNGTTGDERAAAGGTTRDFGLGSLNDPRTASMLMPQANMTPAGMGRPGVVPPNSFNTSPPPLPRPRNASIGMTAPGNIDLNNRPVFFGNDGTYGTENSFSNGTDQGEVLVPSIVGGRQLSQEDAWNHYLQTGENMGTFSSPEAADAYATQVHQRDQGLGNMPVPMPPPMFPRNGSSAGPVASYGADTLAFTPNINNLPPQPMQRPAALSIPSAPQVAQQAPVPMQRPPMPSGPPSVPQAPQQRGAGLVKLPSGKMVAPGNYTGAGGRPITVGDDGNGNAVVTPQRSGFINLGREMNAPTIVGGLIRSKVPEALGNVGDQLGYATDNVKNAAVNAATSLGNTVGGFGSGLLGLFGGNKPPTVNPWQAMASAGPMGMIPTAPQPMSRPPGFYSRPRNPSDDQRGQNALRAAGYLNSFGMIT